MAVYLKTSNHLFEIGTGDFFISFFDTIEYRLTSGSEKNKYHIILNDLYNGHLAFENLEKAEIELKGIQEKLKKFKPSEIIWDKNDLTKTPPWGDNISDNITDLSNYYVTSGGKDLIEVIFTAIATAKLKKSGITIQ